MSSAALDGYKYYKSLLKDIDLMLDFARENGISISDELGQRISLLYESQYNFQTNQDIDISEEIAKEAESLTKEILQKSMSSSDVVPDGQQEK